MVTTKKENKLSAIGVAKLKEPGYHGDGHGLYLQVSPALTKSWIFRFKVNGRSREMGLGPLHTLSLADAREKAAECRRMLLDGTDPIDARDAKKALARLEAAKAMTFEACATAYITAHRASWKNEKHIGQWTNTITTYVNPVFGSLPVQSVDTGLVMRALEPIWHEKNETASRLRGRIESILDWARVRGLRDGENPARWRGHLDHLLPAPGKVQRETSQHHAALPYREMGAFMKELRAQPGVGAMALQFSILTAARTGEVIGATWREIDFDEKVWTVPAGRMKAKKEHRVPLSAPAIAILKELQGLGDGPNSPVFPGAREGKPLSNMAMLALLKRMKRADLTAHGFRSTFRDWAAERTNYPREAAEMALAHTIGDAVEAAYRRGDLFQKRARMMGEWARFCAHVEKEGSVTPINAAA